MLLDILARAMLASSLSGFESGVLESTGFYTPTQLYLVCRAILVCSGRRASKEEEADEAKEEAEAEALAVAMVEAEQAVKKETDLLRATSPSIEVDLKQSPASVALAKLRNKASCVQRLGYGLAMAVQRREQIFSNFRSILV